MYMLYTSEQLAQLVSVHAHHGLIYDWRCVNLAAKKNTLISRLPRPDINVMMSHHRLRLAQI